MTAGGSLAGAALAVREAYLHDATRGLLPRGISDALADALNDLTLVDPTDVGSPSVRRTDPATSRSGAASSTLRAGSQRARLLHAFTTRGDLTADEAHARTTIPPTACYWKRVSELAAGGLVEPTGETRAGRAGEQQTAYRITDAGRAALHALWEQGR